MTIPIKKEPSDCEFGFECCRFCGRTTLYWHMKTNNPVCPSCSKIHKVSELKNHMKKLIILICLLFGIQTLSFAGNDWLVREIKHPNQKGVGHTSHGKGHGFGHDKKALVLFLDGKIKGGDTKTCGEVIQSDILKLTEYPTTDSTRPTIIKRAVEEGTGVVWDEYSDGSFDVFCYNDDGNLSQVINTETGIKNEFIYQEDGDIDLYIQYDNESIDTYNEDGRQVGYVYESGGEITVNRMIWNADYTNVDYQRGTQATTEEINLYNQYF